MNPDKIKLLGHGELADESAVKAMGDTAVGIITSMYYDYNHDSALNRAFVAAYNEEFKRNPDLFSFGGYDGMHMIYEALRKTGGEADGDSLVDAIKGMSWESPRGPTSIDPETRDIINTAYIRRAEKVNGQIRNVEIAKFDNVKDPVKARMK
jgi:branched-chain amino acid transport system substrate-binding protein